MGQTVNGFGRTVGASVTRPNDTNAYTAGDTISDSTSAPTVLTFPDALMGANQFSILQQVICIDSANVSTKPDLELWLFDTAPAAANDNAALAVTDAELVTNNKGLVAIVTLPTSSFKVGLATSGAGGNSVCIAENLGIPITSPNSGGPLYALLVVRNAYAPVANETFTFKLKFAD